MDLATRDKLIELADAHQEADEYISGRYEWRNGACSIGCTIRDAKKLKLIPKSVDPGDHAALARINGIPEMVWRLVDNVFEGLPDDDRPAWTPRFLRAIRPDADYTSLPARIMARCARKLAQDAPQLKDVCEATAALWDRRVAGDEPAKAEWTANEEKAGAARQQAGAAWQQAHAAWQQAGAAWQQAGAARQQADAAWQQAHAAWQQAGAAWHNFWKWCADMMCEELAK